MADRQAFTSFPAKSDVLVIGGGIVGAGVARDAAMRGLKVALVDQFDFAFGTSSRSSRLLHGGLRYLAQGRLGMVREASVEKGVISRIAPHLCKPLPFVFPTRARTEWKRWKLHIGVKLYDLLCSGRNLGKSSALSVEETLDAVPGLSADHLTGAVRYFDGLTNDARLVLDTLASAEKHGATLRNYCALRSARRSDAGWVCELVDSISGEAREIFSPAIVNAAGAWVDQMPASRTPLRLTKGVHLVIDRDRLPLSDALVMTEGSRILFAIPWGDRMILGTTDTDYSGDRAAPTSETEDAQYILCIVNSTFPNAHLVVEDIISAWVGLRPLIAAKNGGPSDISRRHLIRMTEPGWFDVAGGKLTTYRLMAEQTVDQLCERLHRSAPACTTSTEPLLPDSQNPQFTGILPPDVTRDAVEHYCANEWAVHLEDVMIRRTSWRHYHRDHLAIAQRVAEWMSDSLKWSQQKLQSELDAYRTLTQLAFVKEPSDAGSSA